MPIFFYLYGKKIRAKSKFAPAPDIQQDKKRDEESVGSEETTANSDGNGNRERETEKEKERNKKD
jgi:DHA1 family multidrug resistance protein-like MFS transporter